MTQYKALYYIHGSHVPLISGKSTYFETWAFRPWKSHYFWIFSIEVREKSLFWIAVSKLEWWTSSCTGCGLPKWWQWRRTFRESQRPVNQSPVLCGMTASGSRQNTCFIHKILLRSNWEPIGTHMLSRGSCGSCMQFNWSTVSLVYMVHALQNIKHSLANMAI